jgi:two-component sensor histidine kinase/CheY-like chemotaxis protein
MQASETRWRDMLDRMQEGCFIGEILRDAAGRPVDYRHVEINAAVERLTGIPAERLLGRLASEVLPAVETFWLETFARVVDTGEPAHVEHESAALGRWYEASVYRVGPGRFGSLFLDVTARRAAAERQALLTREVDHRAKNALAVVQSVVRLTRASEVRDYVRAVEGRVAALARAHTLLAEDRWRGADLRAVVEEELAAYRGGDRLVLRGPPLRLRSEAVQPLSMVLHELATNAAKYGALSTPAGRLDLGWRRLAGDGALELRWRERDGPPVAAPPDRQGFGSTLIAATVRGQLGGRAEMRWAREGLCCTVTIAADRIAPAGGTGDDPPDGALAPPPRDPAAPGAAPPGPGGSLRGHRVLVVEDEPLVALELAETLSALGCEILGPAATLAEALRLAEAAPLAAAVLDVNLQGQPAFPVAELLARRGVPVVWATAYGTLPPGQGAAGPMALLRKPLAGGELEAALRRLLSSAAA